MLIKRPPLRWFGGKWKQAKKIFGYFPPHSCYVEPFGGGASVLLRKPPSLVEIYNDLDGEVVNFFRVLREQPEKLVRSIWLTPYSREEAIKAWDNEPPTEDPVERARRLYVRAWQTIGGYNVGVDGKSWRCIKTADHDVSGNFADIDHLYAVAERLKLVQIEKDDALAVVRRFATDETLQYIDPPYPQETRYKKKVYHFEMNNSQHEKLAETIQESKGMFVVSSYQSELYDHLYFGWEKVTYKANANGGKERIEVLYLSPTVSQRLTAKENIQMELPLFHA